MSSSMTTPREMVELLRKMVEGRDGVAFSDLFAEDGVLEYPFTAPGFPTVYKGLTEIRAIVERMAEARDLFDVHEVTATVHETADPEVIVAEIAHHGHSHVTNKPYQMLALGIIRVRDGKIVHYRDFMNPLSMADFLGRTGTLIDALSASGTGGGR